MLKKKFLIGFGLLLVVLLLGLSSVSFAYTFDEYCEFLQNTYDIQQSGAKVVTNRVLAIKQNLEDYLYNNFTMSQYDGFIMGNPTTSPNTNTSIYLYLFKTNYNSWQSNASTITWKPNGYYEAVSFSLSSINFSKVSRQSPPSNDSISLIGTPPTTGFNTNSNKIITSSAFNYFDLLGATNRDLNLLPWYFANARVGQYYYNDNISFQLLDNNNNFVLYLNAQNKTLNNNGGYQYQLEIPYISWNNNNIINGNYYKVAYNDNNNNFFVSDPFIISWSRDTSNDANIINNSGDSTGYIDLTSTNNKIDLVNSSIVKQTQAIISGDKEIRDAIINKSDAVISGEFAILGALTDTTFSGDISLQDLPQVEIDDPSDDFFSWLLANIEDFFIDFDNTTLVIPIYNENFEIDSDIFVLNVEPLASFISIGWWFICGIPLLKWVRHTIETIRSGNIPQVDDKSDLLGNVL